jgi:hypothetical protein
MTLPPLNETRRLGLEILSTKFYEGPAAASALFAAQDDPDVWYAIASYYLTALSDLVEYVAVKQNFPVAEVLKGMGNMILKAEDDDD